jgi:hypothetical protein
MGRTALVLPGARHGPHAPLLMYAADAAEARGAQLRHLHWDPPYDIESTPIEQAGPWVSARLPAVADDTLLIGKSLGSHGAALAAERGLPAVWLTPLLTIEPVVDALRRATAPFLLVGGTADRVWDGGLARKLSPHVLEVDGANHGMYLPGRLVRSTEVLGRVATAVEDFLDEVVWP